MSRHHSHPSFFLSFFDQTTPDDHLGPCSVPQEQLASEIARIRVSKEGQEGLSAFLEKRKPSWIVS